MSSSGNTCQHLGDNYHNSFHLCYQLRNKDTEDINLLRIHFLTEFKRIVDTMQEHTVESCSGVFGHSFFSHTLSLFLLPALSPISIHTLSDLKRLVYLDWSGGEHYCFNACQEK